MGFEHFVRCCHFHEQCSPFWKVFFSSCSPELSFVNYSARPPHTRHTRHIKDRSNRALQMLAVQIHITVKVTRAVVRVPTQSWRLTLEPPRRTGRIRRSFDATSLLKNVVRITPEQPRTQHSGRVDTDVVQIVGSRPTPDVSGSFAAPLWLQTNFMIQGQRALVGGR